MADYVRALKWPVISWILLDALGIVTDRVQGVSAMYTPEVLALLAVAFGIWGGYKIVQFKGGYLDAIGTGLILGIVCFVLCVVGFGYILGLETGQAVAIGTFMGSMNLAGAIIGGGFALTK